MRRYLLHTVVFVAVMVGYLAGALEPLDRAATDIKFRVATRKPTAAVTVVAIDPKSLLELQVWPWPRGYHATVLENLLDAGASKVAFDIDFSSRSVAEEDAELEQALAAAGPRRVVLPVFGQRQPGGSPSGRLIMTRPLAMFSRHATLGSINVSPDPDGRTRLYARGGQYLAQPVPALAVALAAAGQGSSRFHIDYGIDVDAIPTLPYVDVLLNRFDPETVRDRVVIIGSTAVELGDQLSVPRYTSLPGSLVQALAVESLIQGRDLRRATQAFAVLVALALCLLLPVATESMSWRTSIATSAALIVLLLASSVVLQMFTRLLIDVAAPTLALVAMTALTLAGKLDRQSVGLLVMDRQIRQTESLMHHVVANSFDAIVTLREDGTVMTFNRVAQKMFGYSEEEALGRNISELVRLPHAEARAIRDAVTRHHRALYESEGRSKDGRRFPLELAVTAIVADGTRRRVMFMRDITERKAQQEALRYQATHDSLTDLPNRNLLQERVEQALVNARKHSWPVALLLFDLDRFKEINDTLGHHIGDLLLRKIARRLEAGIRESDTIARLGGDEFAVLLPATGLENARQIARALIQMLEEPFQVEGLALQVDTSVGMSMFPEHGTAAAALVRRADVAMYVAKRERASIAVYDPEQDFTSIRLLALTGDLRRAIQDGGLTLHYQPKISARDGRPVGVEALARWRHPEHGDIAPEEFVGLAEHSGLIRALTLWVLETALKQCSEWQRQGIDLSMAVNLSARNLLDRDLPQSLMRTLTSTELPVSKLTLEITESTIMEDPQRALEVLTELHELGISISIDDFGTGYSSLGYLKKLPARELKIDKSFVQDMDREPDDKKIVRSTIELAHNLGLRVVAEGVQTRQVWEELRRLGCDVGQGYYFSRPLPLDRLAAWYRETAQAVEQAVGSDAG